MAKKSDLERMKKKINEIDAKFDKFSPTIFAYLTAILQLLSDKGITDQKEFKQYLEGYKKQYSKLTQDAEFLKIISGLKFRGKKSN